MYLTANPKKWLRRLHAWLGAALIALFLFFAITGFALNHRATLKLPLLDKGESTVILTLGTAPSQPEQLLTRLASEYDFPPEQLKIKHEAARQIVWSGQTLTQPEQWIISANQPSREPTRRILGRQPASRGQTRQAQPHASPGPPAHGHRHRTGLGHLRRLGSCRPDLPQPLRPVALGTLARHQTAVDRSFGGGCSLALMIGWIAS